MPYRLAQRLSEVEEAAVKTAVGIVGCIQAFLRKDQAGAILLTFAALLAVIIANSPFSVFYDYFFNGIKFRIGFDDPASDFDFEIRKSILLWINDGLMAVFFFLVGLEIKKEVLEGHLTRPSHAMLPVIAAVGGMIVPACIFWWINKDMPGNLSGWAIPAATDIAFALGVLGLLGSRIPVQIKVLLTSIAIIDDIGAIVVIALFYSTSILIAPLYVAAAALVVLALLNYHRVYHLAPYVLAAIVLWVAVLESGIHATVAGVVAAFFIPLKAGHHEQRAPCRDLEQALHPWVHFLVLPLFALANAGVSFAGVSLNSFFDPLTLGIVAGLFIGKQVGIFMALWLGIGARFSKKPEGISWLDFYAVAVLCGIGFTMSLFIGELAFEESAQQTSIRLGVLTGSLLSAVFGYAIFHFSSRRQVSKETMPGA